MDHYRDKLSDNEMDGIKGAFSSGEKSKAFEAKHEVSLSISSNTNTDRFGNTAKTFNIGNNGKRILEKADITIYEKAFEDFSKQISNGVLFSDPQAKKLAEVNDLDGMMSATTGHEIEHATNEENIQQSTENNTKETSHDTEKIPEIIEDRILDELIKQQ